MERPAPHPQRTLSKQAELDEDEEIASVDPAKEKSNEAKPPPPPINNNNSIGLGHRSRSQSKVKLLVRSHAVCEETSPPPDLATPPPSPPLPPPPPPTNNDINNINSNNNASSNNNSLTVTRHKLRRDGSSQGSFESNSWSPSNSRGSSTEQYTDSTGVDLEQFIAETLNRNQKDRILLLKIEHDLVNLAKDTKRTVHKFPPMSSYQRMLVHRAAAYFGMEHNVDPGGHSVVVNTTKATRIPDSRFKQHLREDLLFPEEPRKSILKRDSASFEETGSFKSVENGDPRRSKSFEEREEEYEKVRRRIFNRNEESGSFEELGSYHDPSWASTESENLNPRQRTNCSERPSARLLKVESYESKDTLRANSLRQTVSKSYSFGGYDQSQPTTRILTKTDSGSSMSSRLSPSSSGYKSQSQRSDTTTTSATPSPTATPHPHLNQMSSQSGEGVLSPADVDQQEQESPTVVWAVTNMSAVPPGSVLINPQTGQPYTNADGSVYHFDPDNPPRVESIIVNPPALTNNNNDSNNVDNSANDTDNANNSCSSSDSAEIVQESAPSQTPTSPAHNPPPSSSTPPPPPPPAESSSSSASSSRSPSPSEPAAHQECPPQEPAPPPQEAPPQEKPPAPQPAPAVKPSPIKQQHSTPRQQDSISSTSHHASNAHPPHNNSSQNMNGFREADKYVHHPAPTTHYGHHGGPTSSPLSHHPHHYPMTPPGPMYPPYPPATYNLVLQPPCPENPYRPNQQPPALMYASPAQPVHHSYEHIPPDANDFSGYMLGLNVDGSRNTASHNTDNRTGPPVIYWPHPQMTQGQNKSVPVYYAPATSQVPSPRYNQSAPPPPPAYQHYPSERPGINPYSGSECNMTYPHTALHMYYSTQCNNGNAAPSQATASWNNGASSNNSAPLVTLQYPAAPTPPQNLCNLQYAMYNSNGVGYGMRLGGCYQYPGATGGSNPLGNPQPPLPLPQLYRPPNLQVGRGSGARGSPGMKDMNDYGAHLPVYGLRVMQGNANRLSFALSSNGVKPVPAHHMRKQRPNSGRPLLMTSQPPPPPNPQHHLGQTGYLMSTVAP